MSGHGEKNYTRSLRDEIKAKQEELKALKAKAKEERDTKKSTRTAVKAGAFALAVQVRFVLEEQPAQIETAKQLLDGLFAKRGLAEEFGAFLALKTEEREARIKNLKAKKKAEAQAETPAAE